MSALADVLTSAITALTTIIGTVFTALADNAATIGIIVVTGALLTAVVKFGSRAFSGVTGFFGGLLR